MKNIIKRIFHNLYGMRTVFGVMLLMAFSLWFVIFYYNNKTHLLTTLISWTIFTATIAGPIILNVIRKIKERKTQK